VLKRVRCQRCRSTSCSFQSDWPFGRFIEGQRLRSRMPEYRSNGSNLPLRCMFLHSCFIVMLSAAVQPFGVWREPTVQNGPVQKGSFCARQLTHVHGCWLLPHSATLRAKPYRMMVTWLPTSFQLKRYSRPNFQPHPKMDGRKIDSLTRKSLTPQQAVSRSSHSYAR
jgi:hypothetical protein